MPPCLSQVPRSTLRLQLLQLQLWSSRAERSKRREPLLFDRDSATRVPAEEGQSRVMWASRV